MAFRLTVLEKADLTTVRLAGRLGNDAVTPLNDACAQAPRPIVLDLSQVTGASDAAVLLLRRLSREGIHLLGASQYVTLLLAAEQSPTSMQPQVRPPRRQSEVRKTQRKAQPNHQERG